MNISFNQESQSTAWAHLSYKQGMTDGEDKAELKDGKIFAGDIKDNHISKVDQVRERFKNKAKQIVENEVKNEMQFSKDLDEIQAYAKDLEAQARELEQANKDIIERKETIREGYGVGADSQEQKDLALLEKANDKNAVLSDEERKRLSEMGEPTDYQKEILALNNIIDENEKNASKLENQAQSANKSVVDAKIEKLKSHAMEDAYRAAEDLMLEANKEVIKAATEEAKEHIDEELNADDTLNEVEEADESKSKEEVQKDETEDSEIIDLANEKSIDAVSITSVNTLKFDTHKITAKVLQMAQIEHLTSEDMKGIMVDTIL